MGNAVIVEGSCSKTVKVNLSGLKWLPLTTTLGMPYINAIENNPGWRLATKDEVESLLQSLQAIDSKEMVPENFEGANWFLENFGIWDSESYYGTASTIDFFYNLESSTETVWRGTVSRNIFSEEGREKYREKYGKYPENSGQINYGQIINGPIEVIQDYSAGFLLVQEMIASPNLFSIQ